MFTARPSARPGASTVHQRHSAEFDDGQYQGEDRGTRDPRRGLPRTRRPQEGATGHATLSKLRC